VQPYNHFRTANAQIQTKGYHYPLSTGQFNKSKDTPSQDYNLKGIAGFYRGYRRIKVDL